MAEAASAAQDQARLGALITRAAGCASRHVRPPSIECQRPLNSPLGEQPMTDIPLSFLDNPHAPDVFADGGTGFFLFGGNIRITFESLRVNHATTPGPVSRVVIGRLVMPMESAENLDKGLLDFIEKQRSQQNAPTQQGVTKH